MKRIYPIDEHTQKGSIMMNQLKIRRQSGRLHVARHASKPNDYILQ